MLPNSLVTELFCHRLHTLAWRQNNFMLADRMFQYLKDHPSASSEGKHRELLDLSLQYERILQKHAEGKQDDAVIDVWSLIHMDIISAASAISVDNSSVLKAKACLKLSSWLRQDDRTIDIRNFLSKVSQDFKEYCDKSSPFINMEVSFSEIDPLAYAKWNIALEEVVGIATKLSCQLCPTMGRAWLSYASWCFSQAQGSVPANGAVLQSCFSPYLHPEISVDRFQLTKEETSRLEAAIRKICVSVMGNVQSGMGDEEKQLSSEALVNKLVQKAKYLMEAAAGLLGVETSENHCPSAILAAQLQMLFLHENSSLRKCEMLSSINEVIDIWWSLRIRRVSLFGHAARGYFNYLSNSSSQFQEVHPNGHFYSSKEKTRSNTLRAMLYILHILSNYGAELQEILESGFSAVVLFPWQEITPQLYARLSSHPKEVVRKQLEGLIMMLAKQSPWSIVFPTLVDMNTYEGTPSEELQHIYDCLAKIYPNLVQDVQLVINELGAITVLWEEQWLSTLQDLHTDVLRRVNMLKEEAARLAVNSTLTHAEKNKISAAKYSAMMAPIIVALERRLAMTTRTPETDHELWFLEEYGDQLKSAILAFKAPPSNAAALGEVWRPFDSIATSLASCLRKSSISLSEIAPRLAKLCSSNVPMPGLEKQVSILDSHDGVAEREGIITISSLCNNLTMLPTKTRPKKLVVLGSDGQKYTYLLKGREDLRLDARIMQLLQAVDSFLKSCGDTQRRSLGIRYYSVTPISGRAGLIQWVDNVTSIYSIFKSWQTRNQHVQLSATGSTNMNISMPPVPRPSDMFYGKIIPALKEKGIRKVISRRDWPHEVKRKVLLELMKETPRQLLWQEMWCASEGFKEFNLKAKRFSGSVGAMSMLGHFLGLGDRHLDNILMDFSSGDVVHIDYNVCFEKGRRLKIPEIVPFRLTQIIESALGLTGIEGAFRANCESVVSILRKNKDVILMLLEVFLWDPLVEWTRGDIHDEAAIGGEEKKGMELAVSLSLFASRVQEIRVKLQEHHDLLLSTIPAAESSLKRFLNILNHYEVTSALSYHVDKEKSSLLQREASAKAMLAEASSISEETRSSFELHAREYEQAKDAVAEQAQEATMWIEQHRVVLDALRGGSTPDPRGFLKLSSLENALSLLAAVSTCGVPLTVVPEPTQAQCYDLDREVAHVAAELDSGLSSACEALHDYALVMQRVLPLNYMTTSPVYGWMQILQVSMTNLSSDVLSLVRRQAAELIMKVQKEGLEPIKKRHLDLFHKMEVYITEIDKVNGECSELMSSLESDTEAKSKERLVSSFTKYLQFESYSRNIDDVLVVQSGENKHNRKAKFQMQADIEEKKATVLTVVCTAAIELYKQIRSKIHDISNHSFGNINWSIGIDSLKPKCTIFNDFEEQVEKSTLVAAFVNEIQELLGTSSENVKFASEGNWASLFQATLCCTKSLVDQITMIVLPELIRLSVSNNSEVMEAFGCLSKVRSSIDTSLEQLVEVQLERMSLMELEKTYSMKVGLITEQQLALEEASAKGREHLSWEEAEELASQEESCRAQLDQLHQTWSQKDMKSSSLTKIEVNIKNTLVSAERYFSSLTSKEQDGAIQLGRGKILLAALIKPFSELESIDKKLSSYDALPSSADASLNLSKIMTCSFSISETIWRFTSLLKGISFFMWKIGILDSILDSCVHDISSSIDQNLGYDQLYNILKKKLECHLQEQIDQYIKGRVAPVFMHQLERESEKLQQVVEGKREIVSEQIKKDVGTIRRVQDMLEEYCNAHETARAARSAVSVMKKQALDLSEALGKTVLEIVQLEWLHDLPLSHPLKAKILSQNILGDDKLSPMVVNLSRQKLLDKIQHSVSTLARSIECLQACEQTSVPVEGQLERAMGWACGGQTNTGATGSSVKNSGIPSEFHDHLLRRRQLLWAAREQATSISNVCAAVMEFEASRDGIFRIPSDKSSGHSTVDGRLWQQAYLKALNRLDVAYHSFSRAEQEWKLAQNRLEAAANSLFSVSNELSVLLVNAKSASDDLHDTLKAMHECAIEAATALSAFAQTSRGHTALTSDCGSMLEEVLAITENLPDVYGLGKAAVIMHRTLMEDLSKINRILLPLETSLSADKRALADAISNEKEGNSISSIHGQVLYQSYFFTIREASESLTALVPSVTNTIKELYSMLTKLARISSLHAGNLHKALQGLGESVLRSQELALSGSELRDDADTFDSKNSGIFLGSNGDNFEVPATSPKYSFQVEGWISPPEYTYTGSPESSLTSIEACLSENSDRTEHFSVGKSSEDNGIDSISFTSRHGQERTPEMTESQSAENRENFSHSTYAVTGDPCETMHALPAELHDVNCSVTALRLNEEDNVELSSSTRAKTTGLNHSHDYEKKEAPQEKPLRVMDEQFQFKKSQGYDRIRDDPSQVESSSKRRGTNVYAMSVLKQVELKLEGREKQDIRPMKITEQVDYLLRQATSIDNLCNMYEGWTPWI